MNHLIEKLNIIQNYYSCLVIFSDCTSYIEIFGFSLLANYRQLLQSTELIKSKCLVTVQNLLRYNVQHHIYLLGCLSYGELFG